MLRLLNLSRTFLFLSLLLLVLRALLIRETHLYFHCGLRHPKKLLETMLLRLLLLRDESLPTDSIILTEKDPLGTISRSIFLSFLSNLFQRLQRDWVDLAAGDFLSNICLERNPEEVCVFILLQQGSQFVNVWVVQEDKSLFLGTVDSLELKG